jgi:hypothetical protein
MVARDPSALPKATSVSESHFTLRNGCVYQYDDLKHRAQCAGDGTLVAKDSCSGDAALVVRAPGRARCGPGPTECTTAFSNVEVDCVQVCTGQAAGRTLARARCGPSNEVRCGDGVVPDACNCTWRATSGPHEEDASPLDPGTLFDRMGAPDDTFLDPDLR